MRADQYLTANGHYDSRARAQAAIKAGLVSVDGKRVKKPSEKIKAGAVVTAGREHPWVSRGGVKLDHALTVFGVNPTGRIALDVGASTGGFTHVLTMRGITKVPWKGKMRARFRHLNLNRRLTSLFAMLALSLP